MQLSQQTQNDTTHKDAMHLKLQNLIFHNFTKVCKHRFGMHEAEAEVDQGGGKLCDHSKSF